MASQSDSPREKGPHQPRSLNFPSRQFGKTKVVSRSFQSKWFDKYKWLHYDEAQDAAYCYTCRTAEEQGKLKNTRIQLSYPGDIQIGRMEQLVSQNMKVVIVTRKQCK